MILEMNNVDELFHQIMTKFLQTDIDGSLDFSLNAITIELLEKYLKTFYTPPLDIDQIPSIWDQLLTNDKAMDTVTEEVQEFASKATIIPFSIFMSMFHQRFMEHRFLKSTLELLQQFYLQTESIAHDYKVFLGDQSKFCLKCLCCEKNVSGINWENSINCTHGYLSSFENIAINPCCQQFTFNFQKHASPFHLHKKLSSIRNIV
jgi:hypothetical protein